MNRASILLLALASCTHATDEHNAAWFEEQSQSRGLVWTHQAYASQRFDFPEVMGGGVALLDADSDGDLDVLFIDSGDLHSPRASQGHPRYFENDGAGRFADATQRAGFGPGAYGMGVACADYDNDGDVDVLFTGVGATALYRNERGHFSDVTAAAGAQLDGWSTSAGFWDYDLDGWLDLFVVRYVDWSMERELDCRSGEDRRDYCSPARYAAPSQSALLHNRGDGTFEEVSQRVGLDSVRSNGLGLATGRVGSGSQQAAFVANDLLPNHAWISRGDVLVDAGASAGVALNSIGFAASGMGIQAVDFDDDGDLDVYVTHLRRQGNSLYVQGAEGRFRDEAARAGLFRPSLPFTGFGCGFADFDCDGDLDLYVANGRVALEHPIPESQAPYAEANQLYEQMEGSRFVELSPRGGLSDPAIGSSRAVAFGDLDNDGGIDLVVVDQDARAKLLHNCAPRRGNWVGFRVLDEHGRDAIGARVELVVAGRSRYREVNPVYGYLTSNDPRVHFGIGAHDSCEALRVRWLDGSVQEFPVGAPGAYHTLSRAN